MRATKGKLAGIALGDKIVLFKDGAFNDGEVEVLYTISKAAEILQVHRNTIDRYLREGKLPFKRTPGGRRRISSVALTEFVQKGKKPASSADFFADREGQQSVNPIKLFRTVRYPRNQDEITIVFKKRELTIRFLGVTKEEETLLNINWSKTPISRSSIEVDSSVRTLVSETFLEKSDWNEKKSAISTIIQNRLPKKIHGHIRERDQYKDLYLGSIECESFVFFNPMIPPPEEGRGIHLEAEETEYLFGYNITRYDGSGLIRAIQKEIEGSLTKQPPG